LRAALVLVLLLAACVEKRDEALSPAGPGVAFAELPFEKALERVRSGGGLVMVNVHAEWCGWCRRLEKEVYSSPRAGAATRGLVAISVDGEVGEGMKIASRYGVRGFPTIFFVDSRGELVQRIDGYVPLDEFLKTVASLPRGVH
jgi:thiol:disulfide interchange protein